MHEEDVKTMSIIYRHYGNDHFDASLVKPVKNRDVWVKPYGGFWASRADAEYSWAEWCKREEFEVQRLEKHFNFTLKDDTRILNITNENDLADLKRNRPDFFAKPRWDFMTEQPLDFERIAKEYDAVEINAGSNEKLYFAFYGWACDSIVIFDADKIEEIQM